MNNTGKILLIGGVTTALVVGSVRLAKAATTADKLDITLDNFSLKSQKLNGLGLSIKIPKIIFNADLTVHNPTSNDLEISQPYIKVFYQDNKSPIAHSAASSDTHIIKSKQGTPIHVDVEFNAFDILPIMPDFLKYIVARLNGKKSTRNVRLDILVSAAGINNTITREIAL
jgi:hypothetical protein